MSNSNATVPILRIAGKSFLETITHLRLSSDIISLCAFQTPVMLEISEYAPQAYDLWVWSANEPLIAILSQLNLFSG